MSSLMLGVTWVNLPPTSRQIRMGSMVLANQRLPTDPLFSSNAKLVSLQNEYGYSVRDATDTVIGAGNFTSPTFINGIQAFTDSDQISVSFLKYAFKFSKSVFVVTPLETLMFMAQVANTNVTLDFVEANALTGITIDKALKTITVSSSHSINNIYDYLQAFQSLAANVDILDDGEILSTVQGVNFTLNPDWSIIFSAPNVGLWNLTATNVTVTAPLTLTTFNLTGTLFFDVSGTYSISDSLIDNVDTVDGSETVTVEPIGSTLITANLDSGNITINTPSKTLTLTGLQLGTDVVILQAGTNNVLDSVDQVLTSTFTYVYNSLDPIDIGIIKAGYVTNYTYGYALGATSSTLPIKQLVDRNYL